MRRAALLLLSLGMGLYGLKLASDAATQAQAQALDEGAAEGEGGWLSLGAGWLAESNYYNPFALAAASVEQSQVEASVQSPNVRAWLAMIKKAEGTDQRGDPYRVCYGYRYTIQSFADHPAITGEWRGEDISSLGPAYVGKVSTAAGAYQIRKGTWLECQRALSLTDFSPASQDAAAVFLTKRRGALQAVEAGDIVSAIRLCRNEWASLPGGDSGQPQRKQAELMAAYQAAGGYLA
ncbi:MAG: glycoside hydrolase family 104 protein [Aquabacterium sp.]|uniref:glycoside hydrolase family 24 protein n=1 Tax=Aquabacterium sp. TaxID=1872578 RepID=UPI003BB0F512